MIVKERLCEELKKAQLSLVNETDVKTKIYYSWDHIPEKLTPGHRQRGKERVELHCLPFYIIQNGKTKEFGKKKSEHPQLMQSDGETPLLTKNITYSNEKES